jgi:nucleotide-binding universal stress UspA family protein
MSEDPSRGALASGKLDLITIGTRGRTGITRMLLGRVASAVVTYAHCLVMVVK